MSGELTQVSAEATARAVRRGCPVVREYLGHIERGVVNRDKRGQWWVSTSKVETHGYVSVERLVANRWRIDPTDRVGRACLAWAASQATPPDRERVHEGLMLWVMGPCWVEPNDTFEYLRGRSWVSLRQAFPGLLAHLDPADDTRLEDGSRWADAEALVLVANHVLGGDHDTA